MIDQTVKVGDYNIRYRDSGGQGPVILLTHGLGASLETWDAQLSSAKQQVRIITWDLPGHGLSDLTLESFGPVEFAQTAWGLLDAIGVEKVVLAGNSLGGAISIQMVGAAPERVLKLCLINAAIIGFDSSVPFQLMTPPNWLNHQHGGAVAQQFSAMYHNTVAATQQVQHAIERNVMRPGTPAGLLDTWEKMTSFSGQVPSAVQNPQTILRSLSIPTLFVHGRQDSIIPVAHSEYGDSITPNSKLLILEGCGHTPQVEQPEAITRLLFDFALQRKHD